LIGRTINQYEILSKLGEGGMGVVYRAHDQKLDRFVALKFLPREMSADPAVRKRFMQEARASSALDHPNISTVHEIGETPEGGLFIVMPCYEGETLSERLERGPLEVAEALKIAAEVANGLSRAHDQGVIHRDVKPGNIMLVADGPAKIMDFGLAMIAGASRLTQDGTMLGTAAYMSPEQAQGAEIDSRTDVWALGAVLYEMLSGRSPFEADHHLAIMYSIMNEEPEPLSTEMTGIPFEVEQLVSKAMEKESDKRFQTAREMAGKIEELREQLDFLPKRGELRKRIIRQRRRLALTAVFSVAAVALIAAAVWYWWPGRAETIDSIAVLPIVNLQEDPELEYLSDGITAELTNELSHVGSIRVISHRTAKTYKESDKPLSEIAQELNVDAVIEGSFEQTGEDVRITVQLIQADPEDQLWTDNFVRRIGDLMDLYSELTLTIAGTIGAKLTSEEEKRLAVSRKVADEVYREFLLGRHFREQLYSSIKKVIRDKALSHFNRAIELDSTYAPARAGAAWVIAWHYRWWYDEDRDSFLERAQAEADRALELDSGLSEVHLALAELFLINLDFEGARKEYTRALELDKSTTALTYYAGNFLNWAGEFEDAVALARKAVDLEPVAEVNHHNLAFVLFVARRYEESIAKCEETRELFPRYNDFIIGMNYEAMGRYEDVAQFYSDRGYEANFSDSASWHTEQQRLISRDSTSCVELGFNLMAYYVARSYAGLGYIDQSLKWLELAKKDYPVFVAQINTDAQFDGLRPDTRFQALMKQMGIPSGDLATLEKP
jgi:serine/threonine protein kinase/tetratricopeptide (TPR) repeat protein